SWDHPLHVVRGAAEEVGSVKSLRRIRKVRRCPMQLPHAHPRSPKPRLTLTASYFILHFVLGQRLFIYLQFAGLGILLFSANTIGGTGNEASQVVSLFHSIHSCRSRLLRRRLRRRRSRTPAGIPQRLERRLG